MEEAFEYNEDYASHMMEVQQEAAKYLFNKDLNNLSYEERLLHSRYIYDLYHPIWKPVFYNNFKTNYEVSNLGQIRNIATGNMIKLQMGTHGYKTFGICMGNKQVTKTVHRLVAIAFVENDDPENKTVVDHLNGVKTCNWAGNLEWVTIKENTQRAIANGLYDPHDKNVPIGSDHKRSKYTEEEVHEVCKLLEQGYTRQQIREKLNIDTEIVNTIRKGGWKHVSSQYNIPKAKLRRKYSKAFKNKIRDLVDEGYSNREIAEILGIEDPNNYGKTYVSKIRANYIRQKGSTTITNE